MTVRLLNPTRAASSDTLALAPRLDSLDGAVIGLINNGKTWGREILQRIGENLERDHGVRIIAITKPNPSYPPADADVEHLAAEATAIIAAIGD